MKKIVKFSKDFRDIYHIKKSFFKENIKLKHETIRINNLYNKQPKRTNCIICKSKLSKSNDFESFRVKYKFCKRCNHLNGDKIISKKFVDNVYSHNKGKSYSKNYLGDYKLRVKKIYLPKVHFLKSIMKKKKIKKFSVLDVGCGMGHFVNACEKKNIKCEGIEINRTMAKLGNKMIKKNKIINCTDNDFYNFVSKNKNDIVSLIGVIEHLKEPLKLLKAFSNSKSKFLYLAVPICGLSVLIEVFNQHAFPRHLGRTHTHLFTNSSINFLAKSYNLKIIAEWWFGTDFMDFYRSMLVKNKNISKNFTNFIKEIFLNNLNLLQNKIDEKKACSEVHLVLQKKKY